MLRAVLDFVFAPLAFGGARTPAVQPLPADNSAAEEKMRLDAERTAVAESKIGGRRSTIVGGAAIAADEQYGRGLLSQKRRMAAQTLGM